MPPDLLTTALLLASAAFAAGVLNASAGGGSFLTLPALIFTGAPPIMANATSALAVSPGYRGSTPGFRPELRAVPIPRLKREMAIAAFGGVGGADALLLLVTPAKVFSGIVPWLLLFAACPAMARRASSAAHGASGLAKWREPGLLVAATAGGFFGARWSRQLPAHWVRTGVFVTGVVMCAVFLRASTDRPVSQGPCTARSS